MALTRDQIVQAAERYGFTVKGFEPGPGTRADIVLRDDLSELNVTIGLWPDETEEHLARLLTMAAAEVRPGVRPPPGVDAWLV